MYIYIYIPARASAPHSAIEGNALTSRSSINIIYIYTHTHIYTHIYIHIYVHTWQGKCAPFRDRRQRAHKEVEHVYICI